MFNTDKKPAFKWIIAITGPKVTGAHITWEVGGMRFAGQQDEQ